MKHLRIGLLGYTLLAVSAGLVLAQDDAKEIDESVTDEREIKEVEIGGGPPPSEEACFNVRTVRDFDGLDDQYIYVEARGDDHFLLTMDLGCIGLRNALGIAISNDVSRVCSNSFATITYRQFGRLETCRVREVEAVEDKAAAQTLAEFRQR